MKNFIKFMVILMSIVLGAYLGELLSSVKEMSFLSFGKELGFTSPLAVDLGFISFSFSILFKMNIASIICFLISLVIVKWVIK